jgi:hypothetical protein
MVNGLSSAEFKQASEYLKFWNKGKTDSEKIYFSKKIVELLSKKRVA